MDLKEMNIGITDLDNQLKVYRSENFYNDKWLYLIAGIHGEDIEGIYLVKEILPWLKDATKVICPCILIQAIDVDGYVFQDKYPGKKTNLNHLFPTSSFRMVENKETTDSSFRFRPEISSLIKLFTEFPPQMVLNFKTAHHGAKVISVGDEGLSLATYLSKATGYPLVADNKPSPGTMEAFIYDFFLCPVVSVRMPHYSEKKTVQDICKENIGCIQQLLSGQVY